MKKLIAFIVLSLGLFTVLHAQKQSKTITETIKVEGVCNMCKKRIEDAAYIKGVKRAEWNKETKILTVTYNSQTTDINTISRKIAEKGHDANGVESTDESRKRLPGCCDYRSGTVTNH